MKKKYHVSSVFDLIKYKYIISVSKAIYEIHISIELKQLILYSKYCLN